LGKRLGNCIVEEQECFSCDAVFLVEHELDEEYYKTKFCPFCGTKIAEEDLDWNDWDEDE